MNISEELKKEIIADLKIDNLAPDYQDTVLNRLEEIILDKANLEIIKSLSEEKREELSKLLEEENDEKITAFLFQTKPDFPILVEDAAKFVVSRFKELQVA
jgi:succinate dehydrogenase flavin-adding protein (antitoxin of CptAB toxin-antitoxin module)